MTFCMCKYKIIQNILYYNYKIYAIKYYLGSDNFSRVYRKQVSKFIKNMLNYYYDQIKT